jgi:hypothetical protein
MEACYIAQHLRGPTVTDLYLQLESTSARVQDEGKSPAKREGMPFEGLLKKY